MRVRLPLHSFTVPELTEPAHPVDIFGLAVTPTQVLSVSGASVIKVYSTSEADFPIAQVIQSAHKIGCHHIATSGDGNTAASVGFGGECKIWSFQEGAWSNREELPGTLHGPSLPRYSRKN